MMRHSVITARQRRCGKVMFWVVCAYQSVCPQGEGSHLTITGDAFDLTVQPPSPVYRPCTYSMPCLHTSVPICTLACLSHTHSVALTCPLCAILCSLCILPCPFCALPHHSITLPCPSAKKEESWNFSHDHHIDYTCWRWPFTVMIKKQQLFVNFDCKWMHI